MDQPTSKEPRGPVSLRIKFRSASLDQFIERYGVDVSRGGIFIRTREPLAVGTQLRFDFQLQDAAPLLAGEGTVVWIRENDPTRAGVTPGMGVRFDKLTPASQPTLEKILAEKGRREQAGAPPKPSPSGGMAVRRPSSTFSALDPAAARAAQSAGASGPPRVGGLSPLGAGPREPAPPTGAAPRAAQPGTGSGPLGSAPRAAQPGTGSGGMRTGAQPRAATPGTGSGPVPTGAAPRAAQPATGSGPMSSKPRTSEQGVPAGIPTLEASGAFGRPRTTSGMSAQRPAPAPAALFEKPTADDIDRALSVLTEVDGPVPEAVPPPVDFSVRTRKATDAQPVVLEASPDVGDAPKAAHRRDTDAQPMVLESSADVGDAPGRKREGTGTRPLFSGATGTGENKRPTQPVEPLGTPDEAFPGAERPSAPAIAAAGAAEEEALDDEEEEDGATSAWVGSGPTRVGGTQPDLPAAPASGPERLPPTVRGIEIPKAARPTPPIGLDVPPPALPGAPTKPAPGDVPAIMAPSFQAPAPKKKTSGTAFAVIVVLLAGAGGAAYFFKDKLKVGVGAPTTTPIATTESAPAPAPGEATVAPENTAAPAAAGAPAAVPEKAPEKAAEKPAGEAKAPTGEATPSTLRARPPGEAPKAAEPEAKPAEAKPEEAKAEGKSERGSRRGKRRGGGASEAAAGGEAAPAAEGKPAVADVSPAAGEAPAAPAAEAPAKSGTALKITTSPAGAEVIIDGNSVGSTPFTSGDVDPGLPHSITLKKDGFEAHERMISGSDWPKAKGGVRTLKLNVKLHATGGEAKPAEEAPAEPPPGLGTTPASPKRE
jgi:uncharacterized protein (TIGR02266 family)